MSASADIRIHTIPLGMVPAMLPHATPHLVRGFAVSDLNTVELLSDLMTGAALLWCIFKDDELVASFFTSVHEDKPAPFLAIYGFGGSGVRSWIEPLQVEMEAHAAHNACRAVRFYGRPAWGRLVPRYRPIAFENGAAVYERALS